MESTSSDSEICMEEDFLNNKEELAKISKILFKKIFEITSSKQNFQKIYKDCERRNIQFIDNFFPPNENSLIKESYVGIRNYSVNFNNKREFKKRLENNQSSVESGEKFSTEYNSHLYENKKWKRIKWLRSKEIYEFPTVFNKEILDPNQIKQGALRNSNFLSVLASIVEFPLRIKSLFLTSEINPYGIYGIKLCINGEWREVVVDDYFPCDIKRGVCCFSRGDPNSLWVQIIEKCYAKAYGSYNKIQEIPYENILRDFTGAPTTSLDNSNENLIAMLKEASDRKWIVTASAGETEASRDLLKEVGLLPYNSYSILQVIESLGTKQNENFLNFVSNSLNHSENECYLKIRNPWSKNEWIGDISDNNNLPKEDSNKYDEGCFYMNLKDFKHYFSKIQICKVFDDYFYNSLSLEQNLDSFSLLKFKISYDNASPSFITILHQDKHNHKNNIINKSNYFTSRLILCKINKHNTNDNSTEELEYIEGKIGTEREMCDEIILKKGEYLLYVEIDWKRDSPLYELYINYPFILSFYSVCDVELTKVKNSDYPCILEDIYKSCARKQNIIYKFVNEGAPNCHKYSNVTPEGYFYIYLDNLEKDATLIEDVKYTKFEGLKLLPPFSGTSYNVKVEPGASQIILIKQIDVSGFNMIYSYHSNFLFSKERLLQLTKAKGKKTFRKDTKLNIDLDIIVYTYKYSLGLCFYYQNNTSDRKLEETLKIKGFGIEIVNQELLENSSENNSRTTYNNCNSFNIFINLEPKENKLIELRAKKNNWSVQSSVSYKIECI